ncbi:MAG: hypothetical protein K1X94_25810 [Sandaracinaceae bacterium]|jgi:hypothetical protein|nr:hypothetical protein [Sandaracinaceae bacterium]
MRLAISLLLTSLCLAVIGCGGSSRGDATQEGATGSTSTNDTTSGGESTAPRTLYTTTPVPVPQPAVPRDRLAQPTQDIWIEVERAIAERPPEPPHAADENALTAWYGDAFAPWLRGRVDAGTRAEAHANDLEGAPPWERGVAAGLLGYFHEQTAAEARGAPIPASIADDPELLAIYSQSLDGALMPLVRRALEAYRFCLAAFDELAGASEGPAWQEWRDFCEDRGEELVRVYTRPEADAPSSSASSAGATQQGAAQ